MFLIKNSIESCNMDQYKVRFINYPKQYRLLKKEIDKAIFGCLEKGDFILRDDVKQFEKNVASFLGTKFAIGVNCGTDALFFSSLISGLKRNDEVITVAHTYVASVAAVVHCGAKPVLIDVGEDMNMNADFIEESITEKTKAIMPVHLNGRMCNMRKIMKIANEHGLLVIEDAAQAWGAKFDGKNAGSFGFAGCFSMYPAKIFGAYGDAGVIATNDEMLNEQARIWRDGGRKNKQEVTCFGYNSLLDNLQAAVLNVKFKRLPRWIERRREIARQYNNGLSDLQQLKLPPAPTKIGDYFDVFQNYVVRCKQRDALEKHLNNKGIETMVSWRIPLHKQKDLGLQSFNLPKTEKVSSEVLSLPLYPELTNEQVNYVIKCVRSFY